MSSIDEPDKIRFLVQDRRSTVSSLEYDLVKYTNLNQVKSIFQKLGEVSECGLTGLDIHPEFSDAWLSVGPNGTGFLTATTPDGTTGGGICRGINAVDWQIARNNPEQVALGDFSVIMGGINNENKSDYGFIGSGQNNIINSTGTFNSILGGLNNDIQSNTNYSNISGGLYNTISQNSFYSSINGGKYNFLIGKHNIILGGSSNLLGGITGGITGYYSSIIGGLNNTNLAQFSTIGAGINNKIEEQTKHNFIGAGNYNLSSTGANYSIITSGTYNTINGENSSIIGGSSNLISNSTSSNNVILSGKENIISGNNNIIASGQYNNSYNNYGGILGGISNVIQSTGSYSVIIGGKCNLIDGGLSSITGSSPESATGPITIQQNNGNATSSTILGGTGNIVIHDYSVVMGKDYQSHDNSTFNVGGSLWVRDIDYADLGFPELEGTGLVICPTGPQGPPGLTGNAGFKGETGMQGLTGPPGDTGVQGPTGIQGSTGEKGETGPPGDAGPPGVQGSVGPPGDQGNPGPPGNLGPQGIQGNMGIQGDKGETGPPGPTGAQGSTGAESEVRETGTIGGVYEHDGDPNPSFIATSTWDQPFIFDPRNSGNSQIKPTNNSGNSTNAEKSSILSGTNNVIVSGNCNNAVLGGVSNSINGNRSSILGGTGNFVNSGRSSIICGNINTITDGGNTVIGGGLNNTINCTNDNAVIMGGKSNYNNSGYNGFIGVGSNNRILSNYAENSSILSGNNNVITGTINTNSFGSTIISGFANSISNCPYTLVGGESNIIDGSLLSGAGKAGCNIINGQRNRCYTSNSNILSGINCQIGNSSGTSVGNSNFVVGQALDVSNSSSGGSNNISGGAGGLPSIDGNNSITIGNICTNSYNSSNTLVTGNGGRVNDSNSSIIGCNNGTVNDTESSLIGGICNSVNSSNSTIFGGTNNTIDGSCNSSIITAGTGCYIQASSSNSRRSAIIGSRLNTINNANYSVILGGENISVTSDETIFVGSHLYIKNVDNVNTDNVLVWNSTTKEVEYRDQSTITSDIRKKKNIQKINHNYFDIDTLEKIKLIKFQKKFRENKNIEEKTNYYYGFSAQNLQKIIPETVIDYEVKKQEKNKTTKIVESNQLKLDFMGLIAYLTNICQQHVTQIEAMEDKVTKLEIKNNY